MSNLKTLKPLPPAARAVKALGFGFNYAELLTFPETPKLHLVVIPLTNLAPSGYYPTREPSYGCPYSPKFITVRSEIF
jgi:hypothetical protein